MRFIKHVNVSSNLADDLNYYQVIALVVRNEEVILISFNHYNISSFNEFACSESESNELDYNFNS